jgi:hypothetical protein
VTSVEFPNLQPGNNSRVTSQADISYNCLAWAAHYTDRWLDPLKPTGYWPADIPRRNTLNNLTKVYEALGYSRCDSPDLEVGYEKIAIYTDRRGLPQHAARQLENGRWTSKLGEAEDIEHDHLQVFEGSLYGKPARYLRRLLPQTAVAPPEATESPDF